MSGLKHKYNLTKADGRPVDPEGVYFVLKLNSKDKEHAKASREAALTYAAYVGGTMPELATDLRGLVKALETVKEPLS